MNNDKTNEFSNPNFNVNNLSNVNNELLEEEKKKNEKLDDIIKLISELKNSLTNGEKPLDQNIVAETVEPVKEEIKENVIETPVEETPIAIETPEEKVVGNEELTPVIEQTMELPQEVVATPEVKAEEPKAEETIIGMDELLKSVEPVETVQPVVPEAVVPAPAIETPVVETPVVESVQPTVPTSVTPEVTPVVPEAVVSAPAIETPVAETPVVESIQPTVPAPVAPEVTPVVPEAVVSAPAIETPVVEAPAVESVQPIVPTPATPAPEPVPTIEVGGQVDNIEVLDSAILGDASVHADGKQRALEADNTLILNKENNNQKTLINKVA